jgi:hypothetical protein
VINASDAIRRLINICGINDSIRQEHPMRRDDLR